MKFLVAIAVCALAGVCVADSYGKPAYPAAPVAHTYPAHAPHVKCGANLLVGCAPNVAHVPCHPAHGGHQEYHHAAPAPAYHHAPAKKEYGHHAPAPAYHHAPAAPAYHHAPAYEAPKKEYGHHAPAAPAYHHAPAYEAPKKEYGHHAPAPMHGYEAPKKDYGKPPAHSGYGGYKRASDFGAEMEE
ncbi:histidine-rich protein PFHRP-II-like [Anopheles nili]|uniref:histidine-rich protein PFHRP-II-like n=1 Tax=Anopheles nili TaxID=185578 RepID=UPI00237B1C3C|nr:histidine-rich protein PFHRP-II-like [Anopheles nili]